MVNTNLGFVLVLAFFVGLFAGMSFARPAARAQGYCVARCGDERVVAITETECICATRREKRFLVQ